MGTLKGRTPRLWMFHIDILLIVLLIGRSSKQFINCRVIGKYREMLGKERHGVKNKQWPHQSPPWEPLWGYMGTP